MNNDTVMLNFLSWQNKTLFQSRGNNIARTYLPEYSKTKKMLSEVRNIIVCTFLQYLEIEKPKFCEREIRRWKAVKWVGWAIWSWDGWMNQYGVQCFWVSKPERRHKRRRKMRRGSFRFSPLHHCIKGWWLFSINNVGYKTVNKDSLPFNRAGLQSLSLVVMEGPTMPFEDALVGEWEVVDQIVNQSTS